MIVHRHAENALIALGSRMPVPASVIVARLKDEPEPTSSVALEVCRLQYAVGASDSSNGDSVVVIVRGGTAITAMLRRSWSQPFTPASLRVDRCVSWVHPDGYTAEGKVA